MNSKWRSLEQLLVSQGKPDQCEQEEIARDLSAEFSGLVLFPLSLSRISRTAVMAAQEGTRRRLLLITGRKGTGL